MSTKAVFVLLFVFVIVGCSRNTSPPIRGTASSQLVAEHDHTALNTVQRIGAHEADSLVKRGEAIIVDVRQELAYQTAHIKGALSLPESMLAAGISTLPKNKKIITYCT